MNNSKTFKVVTSTYDGTAWVKVEGYRLSVDSSNVLHILSEGSMETLALFRTWEYVIEESA